MMVDANFHFEPFKGSYYVGN